MAEQGLLGDTPSCTCRAHVVQPALLLAGLTGGAPHSAGRLSAKAVSVPAAPLCEAAVTHVWCSCHLPAVKSSS